MEITKKHLKQIIKEELADVLGEISQETQVKRGGWLGVYDHAISGIGYLDSLAGKFGDDADLPEELEMASMNFEVILGAAKRAIADDVAPSWATADPEGSESYRKRHMAPQYENKGGNK